MVVWDMSDPECLSTSREAPMPAVMLRWQGHRTPVISAAFVPTAWQPHNRLVKAGITARQTEHLTRTNKVRGASRGPLGLAAYAHACDCTQIGASPPGVSLTTGMSTGALLSPQSPAVKRKASVTGAILPEGATTMEEVATRLDVNATGTVGQGLTAAVRRAGRRASVIVRCLRVAPSADLISPRLLPLLLWWAGRGCRWSESGESNVDDSFQWCACDERVAGSRGAGQGNRRAHTEPAARLVRGWAWSGDEGDTG